MVIRRADQSDAPRIWEVHADSIRLLCAADYSPEQIEAWVNYRTVDAYRNALLTGETNWVATDGAEILGYATYVVGELTALFVDPLRSRRGIGRTLLETVERHARVEGRTLLTLQSTLTSQAFYDRAGYGARSREQFVLPGGVDITCVRMTKPL
jgi:putative acetyltransferase